MYSCLYSYIYEGIQFKDLYCHGFGGTDNATALILEPSILGLVVCIIIIDKIFYLKPLQANTLGLNWLLDYDAASHPWMQNAQVLIRTPLLESSSKGIARTRIYFL